MTVATDYAGDVARVAERAQRLSLERFCFPHPLPGPYYVLERGGWFSALVKRGADSLEFTIPATNKVEAQHMASTIAHRILATDRINDAGVYLMRCESFVKVGRAKKIGRRLEALTTASPFDVDLLAVLSGQPHHEQTFHMALHAHRHHGEWFRSCAETFEIIARCMRELRSSVA